MTTPEQRRMYNELKDDRLKKEWDILYQHYKRILGSNEDARGEVSKHFTHAPNPWWSRVAEGTKHWNNLEDER